MPRRIERKQGANGTYWVRAAYQPDNYTVPPKVLADFERWRDDPFPTEELLAMRDGPYSGWIVVRRFERDGKQWVLLRSTLEYAIEVELADAGPGRIIPVPPDQAWDLARDADRARAEPTIVEGEPPP